MRGAVEGDGTAASLQTRDLGLGWTAQSRGWRLEAGGWSWSTKQDSSGVASMADGWMDRGGLGKEPGARAELIS
jgi:hypothetical protein